MTTQEYMYWDSTAKTYVPVKQDTQQQAEVPNSPTLEKPEKEEKKSKAKSIAKVWTIWCCPLTLTIDRFLE